MVLRDPVAPSVSKVLYTISEELREYEFNPDHTLFTLTMEHLDPTGAVIETWEVEINCVSNIRFGHVDYSTTNQTNELEVTLGVRSAHLK